MAAQSSPLRAMFEGSFKEGSEDVIALVDVEPSSFSLLLDFFYGRSVEVVGENVEALLDLSARYGVSLLRRHCCAFMADSASPSNACSLLAVADRYDCHRLRKELLAYLLQVRALVFFAFGTLVLLLGAFAFAFAFGDSCRYFLRLPFWFEKRAAGGFAVIRAEEKGEFGTCVHTSTMTGA